MLAEVGIEAGYSRGLPEERYGSELGLITALLEATERWFEKHLKRVLAGKSALETLEPRLESRWAARPATWRAARRSCAPIAEASGTR